LLLLLLLPTAAAAYCCCCTLLLLLLPTAAATTAAYVEVLATAGVDYSFVGDYRAFTEGDYGRLAEPNGAVRVRTLRRGLPKGAYTEEELDYGQIDVLPASVSVTSRTATDLNDDAGR
jgi:hypothetical protein